MRDERVSFERHPRDGELARDTSTGRVGRIVCQEVHTDRWTERVTRRLVHLRPVGGGIEWTADPSVLRPVTMPPGHGE
ncbi:hypothetical protein AB0D08_16300 [Kitasatospora sp. NPDC048540]|uniref:hypothetical protein n=1 Tax=unclassified Kitasatospora TaxID=2633591 RepID=UPI00053BA2F8|nr:hypothetical protein [Kitasatospora sp. MBT63]